MTVLEDRIEMADADANTEALDEWFRRLERMPVPEGFRVEIVGGNVHVTPQRNTHRQIIRQILWAVEDRFGRNAKVRVAGTDLVDVVRPALLDDL